MEPPALQVHRERLVLKDLKAIQERLGLWVHKERKVPREPLDRKA